MSTGLEDRVSNLACRTDVLIVQTGRVPHVSTVGAVSPGVKMPDREADLSCPLSVDVRNTGA